MYMPNNPFNIVYDIVKNHYPELKVIISFDNTISREHNHSIILPKEGTNEIPLVEINPNIPTKEAVEVLLLALSRLISRAFYHDDVQMKSTIYKFLLDDYESENIRLKVNYNRVGEVSGVH